MTYEQVINHFGGVTAAANALNVSKSAVSQWRKDGITIPRQCHIELVTGGALKADKREEQAA
jgi:DNA-binding transcriptional regulator YdaS (Cro superfamily)